MDLSKSPGSAAVLRWWAFRVIGMLVALGFISCSLGCGTLSNGRRWGQDAFSRPRKGTLSAAARNAFFDAQTLIPAAAAIILAAGNWDHTVTDWATEHTPVFGSQENARNASDYLQWTLEGEVFATLLATPSGPGAKPWLQAKAKGLGVEILAAGIPAGTTQLLKHVTNRTRPDGSDDLGFPSGHASNAFAMASLANRNLNTLDLPPWMNYSLRTGNIIMASGTAWARVEGNKHFPSDVLAGAAIGHFLSSLIHDALIGTSDSQRFQLKVLPSKEMTMVGIVSRTPI